MSNSVANLGPRAGELTFGNATKIAENCPKWLKSPMRESADALRGYFKGYGAWDADEIAAWSDVTILAMFVQEVASDLREHLSGDDVELAQSVEIYETTDWNERGDSPRGAYYMENGACMVEFYPGC